MGHDASMEWNSTFRAGLVLGAAVVAWQVISVPAGLTGVFVPVAFGLQLAIVVGLLVRTRDAHAYGQQVLSAAVLSAVASAMIFPASLLVTSVLFPDHEALDGSTPLAQATAGLIGTLVSGPSIGALAALGLRKRT